MFFAVILLSLAALGSTTPFKWENGVGQGQLEGKTLFQEEKEELRLRSRDLLSQGVRLTVHDVEASTAPAVDKGISPPDQAIIEWARVKPSRTSDVFRQLLVELPF